MTSTQEPDSIYKAGSCNIGAFEIKKRMQVAWIGLFLSLGLYIYLTASKVNRIEYMWEFFPLMIFSAGLVQAQSKFCFAFGFKGIANLGGKKDEFSITDKIALQADRAHAMNVFLKTLCVAIIVTGLIIGIS